MKARKQDQQVQNTSGIASYKKQLTLVESLNKESKVGHFNSFFTPYNYNFF